MNSIDMNNEEWAEVYRRHDALVQRSELEMQTEEIREAPRAPARAAKPVELQLHELDTVVAAIHH
jgi:hypothetical protein